jgi:hypothetical protein
MTKSILAAAAVAAISTGAAIAQSQPATAPGAVPAGQGNPYQRARQLPARIRMDANSSTLGDKGGPNRRDCGMGL